MIDIYKVLYFQIGTLSEILEDIHQINEGKIMKRNIYLRLYDLEKNKEFIKHFDTEFEKEKFKRKLKYSRKLMIIEENDTESYR